jgi:single-stranded-DNA-specific exonuclease
MVAIGRGDRALLIDGAISAAGATVPMIETLARAGPFGAGNPEPVVALPSHTLAYAEETAQGHVRARLRSGDGTFLNAIAFRAAGQPLGRALMAGRGQALHAAGTLSVDRWNGAERSQLRLIDVAVPSPG